MTLKEAARSDLTNEPGKASARRPRSTNPTPTAKRRLLLAKARFTYLSKPASSGIARHSWP